MELGEGNVMNRIRLLPKELRNKLTMLHDEHLETFNFFIANLWHLMGRNISLETIFGSNYRSNTHYNVLLKAELISLVKDDSRCVKVAGEQIEDEALAKQNKLGKSDPVSTQLDPEVLFNSLCPTDPLPKRIALLKIYNPEVYRIYLEKFFRRKKAVTFDFRHIIDNGWDNEAVDILEKFGLVEYVGNSSKDHRGHILGIPGELDPDIVKELEEKGIDIKGFMPETNIEDVEEPVDGETSEPEMGNGEEEEMVAVKLSKDEFLFLLVLVDQPGILKDVAKKKWAEKNIRNVSYLIANMKMSGYITLDQGKYWITLKGADALRGNKKEVREEVIFKTVSLSDLESGAVEALKSNPADNTQTPSEKEPAEIGDVVADPPEPVIQDVKKKSEQPTKKAKVTREEGCAVNNQLTESQTNFLRAMCVRSKDELLVSSLNQIAADLQLSPYVIVSLKKKGLIGYLIKYAFITIQGKQALELKLTELEEEYVKYQQGENAALNLAEYSLLRQIYNAGDNANVATILTAAGIKTRHNILKYFADKGYLSRQGKSYGLTEKAKNIFAAIPAKETEAAQVEVPASAPPEPASAPPEPTPVALSEHEPMPAGGNGKEDLKPTEGQFNFSSLIEAAKGLLSGKKLVFQIAGSLELK